MTQPIGHKVRVAASQFFSGTDVAENLARCVAEMRRAHDLGVQLIVLPENANRVRDYTSREMCHARAESIDGAFVTGVRSAAAELGMHVVVNVDMRGDVSPDVFITSLLIDDRGAVAGTHRKHVLWDYEYTLFTPCDRPFEVFETTLGTIGMIVCADGIVPEAARCVALLGAQIICNSLNSRGPDEMRVHEPLRAMENGCFMVAANTVGGPPDGWPWTGGSQVVAPDGTVLALASETEEELVVADIDPSPAQVKPFAFTARRPELYSVLAMPIDSVPAASMYGPVADNTAPRPLRVALAQVSWYHNDDWTLDRALVQINYAARRGAQLVVLPELFCFRRGHVESDPIGAVERSSVVLAALREVAATSCVHVVASLVAKSDRGLHHRAVLVGDDGEVTGTYDKTHLNEREMTWAQRGERFTVCDSRLGRIGLMIGDEVWIPEVARCLALLGSELIAHPCDWDRWQARDLAATERTEENRVHLASCARTDNVACLGSQITIADRFAPGQPIALMRYPTAITTRTGFEEQLVVDLDMNDAHSKMMGWHLDPLATRAPHLYGPMVAPHSSAVAQQSGARR